MVVVDANDKQLRSREGHSCFKVNAGTTIQSQKYELCGSDGKGSICNVGDPSSVPGSGKPPREGNGYPLQYSCHGQWRLAGCSPWGHKESDMTEQLTHTDTNYTLHQKGRMGRCQ